MNKLLIAVAATCLAASAAAQSDEITIEHLGANNTILRVDTDKNFLLLPVQESTDDARINLIVDGKQEREFFVRLAKSKVDYYVPFDLKEYKGKNLLFNIVKDHDRSSIREAKDAAAWKAIALSDSFDTTNRERFRPAFHHTPLYGWMNDPNGMFYRDGVWHLYYQWNPYGSKWQNMTWGHSSSKDLINWDSHPVAIDPNGLGSVFSGSSALDPDNTAGFGPDAVVAMYTSAAQNQTQSLAWSNDGGETFNIYPGNPVITQETEARDPNFFFNEQTGEWNLVLAHALDHEILFYSSPDMKNWTLRSAFGKNLGAQDGVWECPDLFQLPVDGTDEKKWVLIVNLNPGGPFGGSGIQYFIGDFDGAVFTPDKNANGEVETKWLDFGKDNYALVSWSDAPDNRRTAIGWMSNWQYAAEAPTTQFRSANTLPREIGLFRADDGQIYASSVPSPELTAMRGKIVSARSAFSIGKKPANLRLPAENDGICEILLDIDSKTAANIGLVLSNSIGNKVIMNFDPKAGTFSFDRRLSGITDFSADFPAVTTAPVFRKDGSISLRIFIDRSSIEIFGNNGRFCMTNLVFPEAPFSNLSISADGSASVRNLKIYSLNPEQVRK